MLDRGLHEHARRMPQRCALLHRGRSTSYGELEDQANRLAQVLRECGLARGDHVACLLPNGPDIFAFAWAAYRCGLYITPVWAAACRAMPMAMRARRTPRMPRSVTKRRAP